MALANLLDKKVQSVLVWSCIQNTTQIDAPSSFFFNLEKKHGQRNQIHALLSDTGKELSEPGQIQSRVVEFYSHLYTSECKDNEQLFGALFSGELLQVQQDMKLHLEHPLTME